MRYRISRKAIQIYAIENGVCLPRARGRLQAIIDLLYIGLIDVAEARKLL